MNAGYIVMRDSSPILAQSALAYSSREGDSTVATSGTTTSRVPPHESTRLVRMAMRISRSEWFTFLRRVFRHQNASRLDTTLDPFNSSSWMKLELIALVLQISITAITLLQSDSEKPVWPMRMWIICYDFACLISLINLYWRYSACYYLGSGDGSPLPSAQQQSDNLGASALANRCKTCLELFYAMWFVMGNVWMFGTRFVSLSQAPRLHMLCVVLLAWNAISYSFPFLLFVLLCICVPLVSNLIGYNISMGGSEKGASDEEIARLPCWRYKQLVESSLEMGDPRFLHHNPECCICLARYEDKEEIMQLPCSHVFHHGCADHWLRITSCCPLCKQGLSLHH